jgi:hypothetical protein
VVGSRIEVFVCYQQRQFIALAELDEQGINRADLETSTAASIARFGCSDVVLLVGWRKASSEKRSTS